MLNTREVARNAIYPNVRHVGVLRIAARKGFNERLSSPQSYCSDRQRSKVLCAPLPPSEAR
jgi:hypothetical protein